MSQVFFVRWAHFICGAITCRTRNSCGMEEGRKRVLGIITGILVARHPAACVQRTMRCKV
jgi:hypothetical protein